MTSLTHSDIKRIKSLAQKKYRDEAGLFVVEGEKMVEEALRSSFVVEEVYRIEDIGADIMARITQFSTPSPVLALVRRPSGIRLETPEDVERAIGSKGLYLALDGIRDPGNLGTILRVADWFGLDGVLASDDTVELLNPKVVQATMGALFRVKFRYCDLPSACRAAASAGGKVYGTFLDGEDLYAKTLETGSAHPVLLVVGNEARGISPAVAGEVAERLYIPSFPQEERGSESLNAAVAAAVAVAEFRRRT